ncbi:SpoIID/LytB domain-containing protein [Bacillus solitudinis]|uniref:SpoIID/LytB domain-containing protein n=1 Tax=Bacillus solitudinis TaxID=2014074 RepID=UPI000C235514|nr:SpoIID/LytB domain-containing protein [Bacillus solitudinis]
MKILKWMIIALFPICLLLFPGATFANTVVTYDTPVKVKLIPSINFNVKTTGTYRLLNVDNQKEVLYSGDLQFRHTPNQVTVRVGDREYTSNKGFELQEVFNPELKFLTITSVQQSSQFVTADYRGSFIVEPGKDRLTLYNLLHIEDYILGVVPREMPASWHSEALKAQAIAARNYARIQMTNNEFLVDTIANQVYGGKAGEHTRTNQAVRDTRGQYALTSTGKIINAFFHSSSGGYTENSENVWTSQLSYIKAVHDPYDLHTSNSNRSWTTTMDRSNIEQAVFGSGTRLTDLEVTERTSQAKSVQKIVATGVRTATGEIVKVTLPKTGSTPDSLRSTLGGSLKSIYFNVASTDSSALVKTANGSNQKVDYTYGATLQTASGQSKIQSNNLTVRTTTSTISYPTTASAYTFTGSGWGHRLGMSQWGARGMAEAGKTYDEILKHYYTGIKIGQP